MSNRTPLQQLLRSLLPASRPSTAQPPVPDFEDTRPEPAMPPRRPEGRRASTAKTAAKNPPAPSRPPIAWAESSIELAEGTDIVELPDDTVADLMDEFFAKSGKKAA